MKFIHLSDLHLGKRLNEFSLLEDQEYILTKILNTVDEIQPDGVIIAGDVYDKSVPSAEAVALFDDFLYRLSEKNLHVFVISGNHDSPERIAFGGRMMLNSGIHLSPVYDGKVDPITLRDAHGEADIFLLPFIKPANVRRFYPDEDIDSYTDALRVAVSNMNVDTSKRNILVTHQFVTGASRSDSEEISVGGSDNVEVSVFEPFDYVALGHIHGPQSVGRETVRYCGTPLKYSFSEAGHVKSLTVVELGEKGSISISTVPIVPKRDLRELRGKYDELILKQNYDDKTRTDYLHITLTDEEDVPDAVAKLRTVYPNIMVLDYDNPRTRSLGTADMQATENRTPFELFGELYERQNGVQMSEQQQEFCEKLISKIWEGEV